MIFGDTMLNTSAPGAVASGGRPRPAAPPAPTGPTSLPVQISGLSPDSEQTLWRITVYGLIAAGVVAAGASGVAAAAAYIVGRQAIAQVATPIILGLASGAAGAAAQSAVTLYALKQTQAESKGGDV